MNRALNPTMEIGGLQKLTLIDYPGRLAATVFLIGCNFRCPFCYSAELVLPDKAQEQPRVPEKEFFEFLENRKGLLEGVVVCGGEPTLNAGLPVFIKKIKELGFLVKLDTNGSNPGMLKGLIDKELIDYAAMDSKAPIERYGEVVGLSNSWNREMSENIKKSVNLLKEGKIDYEFRTTVVPELLEKKDILKIADWIKPAQKYFLQEFRAEKTIDPKFEKVKAYPKEYLLDIQKEIASFFDVCKVR